MPSMFGLNVVLSTPVVALIAARRFRVTPAMLVKSPPITSVLPTWATVCTVPLSIFGVIAEGTGFGIAPAVGAGVDA